MGYFFPIWSIDLEAPQYPEGLGMKIWINKLDGNINTINGLNHYIGMQQIQENSIPELKYMPYLLGLIIVVGLLVSVVGRKWLLYVWTFLFAGLGVAGGIDFYSWEYDYGHNLDPHAAIKIPGMYYQPPLIGNKQLLNFTAHSFPDIGGWIIIISGLLAILLVVFSIVGKKKMPEITLEKPFTKRAIHPMLLILFSSLLLLGSCQPKEEPIQYGKEMCAHCKMSIVDERFGAEIVTKQAKVYKFDAIECMLLYYNELEAEKKEKVLTMLVADASQKGTLINADHAFYLHSDALPSPMNSNISAYATKASVEEFYKEYKGERLDWKKVQNIILAPEENDDISTISSDASLGLN